MTDDRETARVLARAQALLRSGQTGGSLVVESGQIGAPVAIRAPDGGLHSWFVPVTVGIKLAGFFQFLPDLTLMRYASFQRQEGSLEGCPTAESWTEAETIRRRAQENARSGETVGTPFLTYDRVPSRLAWAVPLTSAGKTVRTLLVAGPSVWEAQAVDHGVDSYGGPAPR